MAYVRPEYEPLVWETRSTDGGTNWTPMSRGAFIMVRPSVSSAFGLLLISLQENLKKILNLKFQQLN